MILIYHTNLFLLLKDENSLLLDLGTSTDILRSSICPYALDEKSCALLHRYIRGLLLLQLYI